MIDALLPILGLTVVALAMAWLLDRARLPGAAIVGGLVIGVGAGPDVLGRFAPEAWLDWFRGGSEARSQLERLNRIEALGTAAGTAAGIESPVVEFATSGSEPASESRETLERELDAAEAPHRRMQGAAIAVLAGLTIAIAVADGIAGWRRTRSRRSECLLLGSWVAVLPAGLGMALLHSTVVDTGTVASTADWTSVLLIASSFAIGPWRMARDDARRAAASESGGADLLRSSGLVATALAVAAAGTAAWLGGPMLPFAVLGSAMALGAIGGVVGDGSPPSLRSHDAAPEPSGSRRTPLGVLVAPMVAIAMLDIAPSREFAWWPVIVAAILTADGRYLGAVIAGVMPGTRRGLRAMRLLMPLTAVGPMQASVASTALVSGALPPGIALALLIGAAIPEVTAPLRARTDRHLRDAEALSEALSEESERRRSDR